jgi:hypothetical protein
MPSWKYSCRIVQNCTGKSSLLMSSHSLRKSRKINLSHQMKWLLMKAYRRWTHVRRSIKAWEASQCSSISCRASSPIMCYQSQVSISGSASTPLTCLWKRMRDLLAQKPLNKVRIKVVLVIIREVKLLLLQSHRIRTWLQTTFSTTFVSLSTPALVEHLKAMGLTRCSSLNLWRANRA